VKRDRDRDVAMDRMLGAGLRASAGAADACPQAGDLAAFVEGGLSRPERETIERHAAACDRCRHALAAIGSMPPPTAAAASASSARPSIVWLRWAIPAASVAVVVLLYVAIRSTMFLPQAGDATRPTAASAPLAGRAAADRPPVGQEPAGARKVDSAQGQQAGTIGAKRVARASAAPAPARNKVQSTAPAPAAPAALAEQVATAPIEARQNQPAQRSSGIAGNPTLFRQQAPAQQAIPQVQAQFESQSQAAPAPAPVVIDRLQPAGAAAGGAAPAKTTVTTQVSANALRIDERRATVAMPVIVVAPGQSLRWRLEPGGAISRSRDGGLTWELQSYRATWSLLAGSAPAPNVCWLVGNGGTVLRTVDAERWEQRPFPERVDLMGVDARDDLHATVTARDGRRFVTDDGGATWR
jgi:hypothetical protein